MLACQRYRLFLKLDDTPNLNVVHLQSTLLACQHHGLFLRLDDTPNLSVVQPRSILLAVVFCKRVFTPFTPGFVLPLSTNQASAYRVNAGHFRCLRHNVLCNVNHNGPLDFYSDAPFADGNNIGFKGCQPISLQILRHLRWLVRNPPSDWYETFSP